MNELVEKNLLAAINLCLKLHLKQPGFEFSTCEPFAKNKERMQKFKETGDSRYISQKKQDKACFRHDMAYGDFEDLDKATIFDKKLRDNAFIIANNPKYDGYQTSLSFFSMVYQFFEKTTVLLADRSGSGLLFHIDDFRVYA